MPLTQENRQIKLGTPLGPNALLVTAFSGREEISKLFHFTLDMISEQPDIKHNEIVGKNVTVSIERSDGSIRYFNGFASRFSAGDEEQGRRNFRAEIRRDPSPASIQFSQPTSSIRPKGSHRRG
ncbi:MAG: hypothetical protein FJ295_04395 [Planctomycetes bacterium]|nr:hypothetical protein [Planctomycetota bacterium]